MGEYLSIFLLATLELWAAVPLGLKLGVTPVALAASVIAGALSGAAVALMCGDALYKLITKYRKDFGKTGAAAWLVRHGVWGVGLLGPLLLGSTLTAALATSIGMPRGKTFAAVAAGIVVWTIAFVWLGALGLALIAPKS